MTETKSIHWSVITAMVCILLFALIVFNVIFFLPNDRNQVILPLEVLIENNTNTSISFILEIWDEEGLEIINDTYEVDGFDVIIIKNITKQKGQYFTKIELDDGRSDSETVVVNSHSDRVDIIIDEFTVDIKQYFHL